MEPPTVDEQLGNVEALLSHGPSAGGTLGLMAASRPLAVLAGRNFVLLRDVSVVRIMGEGRIRR